MILQDIVDKAEEVKAGFEAFKAGKMVEDEYTKLKNELAALLEEGGVSWAEGVQSIAAHALKLEAKPATVVSVVSADVKKDLALASEHLKWLGSTIEGWANAGWVNEIKGKLSIVKDSIEKHI